MASKRFLPAADAFSVPVESKRDDVFALTSDAIAKWCRQKPISRLTPDFEPWQSLGPFIDWNGLSEERSA